MYALKLTCLKNLYDKRPDYKESIYNAFECLEEEKLMNPHFSGLFVKIKLFVRDKERQKTIEECDYLIKEFRKQKLEEMRVIIIKSNYRHQIEDKKGFKEKIEQCLHELFFDFKEETYENGFNLCKNILKKQLAFFLQHQEDTFKKDFQSEKDINEIRWSFSFFNTYENWIEACLGAEAKI